MTTETLELHIKSLKRDRHYLLYRVALDDTAATESKLAEVESKLEKAQESLIKAYLS